MIEALALRPPPQASPYLRPLQGIRAAIIGSELDYHPILDMGVQGTPPAAVMNAAGRDHLGALQPGPGLGHRRLRPRTAGAARPAAAGYG